MTEEELKVLFKKCGSVKSAKIIFNKITGKSKGYGFVEMEDNSEALSAIIELNGKEVYGRKLVINESRK